MGILNWLFGNKTPKLLDKDTKKYVKKDDTKKHVKAKDYNFNNSAACCSSKTKNSLNTSNRVPHSTNAQNNILFVNSDPVGHLNPISIPHNTMLSADDIPSKTDSHSTSQSILQNEHPTTQPADSSYHNSSNTHVNDYSSSHSSYDSNSSSSYDSGGGSDSGGSCDSGGGGGSD